MTERHDDTITTLLALALAAATVLLEAVVAAVALAITLHRIWSGPASAVPLAKASSSEPAPLAPTPRLTVAQLRQQCRELGAPGWWNYNRNQCQMVLAVGGVA